MAKAKRRINFTRKELDGLPVPSAPEGSKSSVKEYWYDATVPELAVRVSSTGAKTFVVYKWDALQQKPVRITLGRYEPKAAFLPALDTDPLSLLGTNPPLNVDHARKFARAALGNASETKERLRLKEQFITEPTLEQVFSRYLLDRRSRGVKSAQLIEGSKPSVMEQDFSRDLGHWGRRRISEITHEDCYQLHQQLRIKQSRVRNKQCGPIVANRRIQLLSAICTFAIKHKLMKGENPCRDVEMFDEQARNRYLTTQEITRLWDVLADTQYDKIRDFILLALLTGARRTNIASMRWDQLDLESGIWKIPASQMKSGKPFQTALTDSAIEVLKVRQNQVIGPWVFPGEGKQGHLMDPYKIWQKIREKAGLSDVRIHDLRRSVATMMANCNVNLTLISGQLGHQTLRTTQQVYAHAQQETQKRELERAQGLFLPKELPIATATKKTKTETKNKVAFLKTKKKSTKS